MVYNRVTLIITNQAEVQILMRYFQAEVGNWSRKRPDVLGILDQQEEGILVKVSYFIDQVLRLFKFILGLYGLNELNLLYYYKKNLAYRTFLYFVGIQSVVKLC